MVIYQHLDGPLRIDSYLIAQAEHYSAARCHEAANLIGAYTLSFRVWERAQNTKSTKRRAVAAKLLGESERGLRRFVFQCRWAERARCVEAVA